MKTAKQLLEDADEVLKKDPLCPALGDFLFALKKYASAIHERNRTPWHPFYQQLAIELMGGVVAVCQICVGPRDKVFGGPASPASAGAPVQEKGAE